MKTDTHSVYTDAYINNWDKPTRFWGFNAHKRAVKFLASNKNKPAHAECRAKTIIIAIIAAPCIAVAYLSRAADGFKNGGASQ